MHSVKTCNEKEADQEKDDILWRIELEGICRYDTTFNEIKITKQIMFNP